MWTTPEFVGTDVDEPSANLHIACGKSVGKPRQGGFLAQASQAAEGLPAAGKPVAGNALDSANLDGSSAAQRARSLRVSIKYS